MSRRRTEADALSCPENYFNRYMALETKKAREENKKYYDMFESLDRLLGDGSNRVSGRIRLLLATNHGGEEFEKYITETDTFAWIDSIENQTLFAAITSLGEKDKLLLTLRYNYCCSQAETAAVLGCSQCAVSKRERRLKKFFRDFFDKGFKKP